jgi:hypothetical protein
MSVNLNINLDNEASQTFIGILSKDTDFKDLDKEDKQFLFGISAAMFNQYREKNKQLLKDNKELVRKPIYPQKKIILP